MPRKLGRSARLRIHNDGTDVEVESINESGLRMTFDVVRTMDPSANTATIEVWNAKEATRNAITRNIRRKKHLSFAEQLAVTNGYDDLGIGQIVTGLASVELEAGYGAALGLLFSGTSQRAESMRSGRVDWVTTIWAGDDEAGIREGTLHKSYSPGTGVMTVVIDLVRAMGASIGPLATATVLGAFQSDSYSTATFPYGHIAEGKALPQLQEILGYLDVRWSIQDGEFVVLRPDGTLPGLPITVSAETGMIDRPKLRENAGLEVAHLLDHRFRPGAVVNMASSEYVGTYRVDQVRHSGDTHGDGLQASIVTLASLVTDEVAA